MVTKRVYKPKSDDEFLEQLSFIRFVSGFRYSLVEERWPLIRKAFHNFSVKKLSIATDADVERVMGEKGVIRNRGKICDVIRNAKLCAEIAKEHGSVLNWVDKLRKGLKKEPLLAPQLKEEFHRFHGIGEMTSGWLEHLHMAKKSYVTYEVPG